MQFFVILIGTGLIVIYALQTVGGGIGLGAVARGWEIMRQTEAARFHLIKPRQDHPPLVPWPSLFMRVVTLSFISIVLLNSSWAESCWRPGVTGMTRIAALVYGSFGMLAVFISVFPGMIAFHLNPHLNPNNAVPFLIRSVVPSNWGARGLILAGLTAAIMSALSSLINSTSTVFVLGHIQKAHLPKGF